MTYKVTVKNLIDVLSVYPEDTPIVFSVPEIELFSSTISIANLHNELKPGEEFVVLNVFDNAVSDTDIPGRVMNTDWPAIEVEFVADNAFALMGTAKTLGRKFGMSAKEIGNLHVDMMSSDFGHAMSVFDRQFRRFAFIRYTEKKQ